MGRRVGKLFSLILCIYTKASHQLLYFSACVCVCSIRLYLCILLMNFAIFIVLLLMCSIAFFHVIVVFINWSNFKWNLATIDSAIFVYNGDIIYINDSSFLCGASVLNIRYFTISLFICIRFYFF